MGNDCFIKPYFTYNFMEDAEDEPVLGLASGNCSRPLSAYFLLSALSV